MKRPVLSLFAAVAAVSVLVVACVDDEPAESNATTESTAAEGGDVAWVPSAEDLPAELRSAFLVADGVDLGYRWNLTSFPSYIGVTGVDGHVLVVTVVTARNPIVEGDWRPDPVVPSIGGRPTVSPTGYLGVWALPQPGRRVGIDLGDDRVLVVGSATMTIEQVIAAASTVTVDGDAVSLPGEVIGELDAATVAAGVVAVWEDDEPADVSDGVMPVWTFTLDDAAQLDALRAIGDPAPSPEGWTSIETVASVPNAVYVGSTTTDVLGATATLMTLNAYSRMLLVPTDPPVAAIANDGVRYPNINDDLLVSVTRSLVTTPRAGLADAVAALPTAPMPTPTFEGTTTSTG